MNIISGLVEGASDSIRNLARNLFSGFYERGISANKALQELRDAGLGYRRQDFLADFRSGQGEYDQATAIRYVGIDRVPSENIFDSKYFGTPDKYSMVFKYRGTDLESGEEITGYTTYHRNSLDTRRSMQDEAQDFLESDAERYPYTIESVSVVEGYINPLWEG